ncbi:MAG: flavin reductase family protein [Thermodesulfobacteriota bacterium]
MPDLDKRVFKDLSYGLYIVTACDGERLNGQLVNTVIQVTSDPPRIGVIINKKNLTHEFIMKSRVFAACVVEENVSLQFLGPFGFRSGRDIDKFKGLAFSTGKNGCPILNDHILSWAEASVINDVDVGTHTIFIGDVVNTGFFKEGNPLTYTYYHHYLKGKTSANAPTYNSVTK